MPIPRYEYAGPVDHTVVPDTSQAAGKSVIITGGANGMGETCVRAFVAAGAFVTFGDVNPRGKDIEAELNSAHGKDVCAFVTVDIRDWDQQKAMFEVARTRSPAKSVDVVIANAGISRSSGDSLWNLDGECTCWAARSRFTYVEARNNILTPVTAQTPTASRPSRISTLSG
jgi:NAD(P)-dependent dehydrogenase (short-subunit alcohol dehydrogenase family)